MNIFQIANEMYEKASQIAETDEALQKDLLEEFHFLDAKFDEKVEAFASIINTRMTLVHARESEIRRLQALIVPDLNQIGRLKTMLKEAIVATGKFVIDTPKYRVSVRANGGKNPLKFEDGADVPDEFCRLKKEPDCEKIRTAIEAGEILDFARLEPRGTHLQIK